MDIRSIHSLKTAENIEIDVELAGVANRVFAFAVDFWVMGCLMAMTSFAIGMVFKFQSEIAQTAIPLSMFILFFGYSMVMEWLWKGKSIGKHLFGIRVVRDNGQPIGFWESFGRNILRVIDVYFSGVGLLSAMLSKREKRFGDYLAGTLVINDQAIRKPQLPQGDVTPDGVSPMPAITSEEYELLQTFLSRKDALLKDSRQTLDGELREFFIQRLRLNEEEARQADLFEMLCAQYRGSEN